MKLKCAITDDEPLALSLLESYVAKTPSLILEGRYSSAVQALEGLREHPVDLLFLDIQMPQLDGLALSRIIDPATRIVFTTAFDSYALDGYRVNALDYLLKPIRYPEFLQAVDKALQWFSHKADTRTGIFLKSEYSLIRIEFDDILYIEGMKDYVKIHTVSSPEPILSIVSLKSMEEQLPALTFMRVHRSYIVNMSKIREVSRSRIIFGDSYVPIGDSYKEAFQAYIDRQS